MLLSLFPFLFFIVLAAAGLNGCTAIAVDPHAGFPQVSQLVNERVGQEIAWVPGPEEAAPVPTTISARLKKGLNETDSVQIALLQNRNLQALYTRLSIAQADLVQASLLHNPVVDLSSGFPVAGGVVDLGFGMAMDFIDLLYTPLRKRVATAQFEETKLRIAAEVLEVVWQTQTAFYRHQANEQMLELRHQVAATTAASSELVRVMREAGNVRELDLASELALAGEAKLDVRLAEIAVRESRERLNILMGLWGEDAQRWTVASVHLPEPREPLDAERFESRAIERSLDLAAAEQLIVAAAENVGLDRISGLFPEVIVGGKGERDGSEWEPGPTFTLPIPLFDHGQARVARAQAELRQARELRSALVVHIHAVARSTRDRLSGHRDRAFHYRDTLLPVRERILHETQLQYNAMQVGPLELLRAKEQQIEAGVRYIEALQDYWFAHADLALLLAGHLPPTEPTPTGPALEQAPRFPFPTLR
ncbi:MAG: TolC family protein [Deltaproteobacteria bacterium]|nr:TolC family protein [Deltaproteobacteria bacterium]